MTSDQVHETEGPHPRKASRVRKWFKRILVAALVLLLLLGAGTAALYLRANAARSRFEAAVEDLRAAGEPVAISDMLTEELPPEENAATIYERAFERMGLIAPEQWPRAEELSARHPDLTPEELAESHRLLEEFDVVLELLRRAAARPKCRFPLDYDALGSPGRWAHVRKLTSGMRLVGFSCAMHLSEDRLADATRDCITILRLAEAFRDDPTLFTLLTKCAFQLSALRLLGIIMDAGDPPREVLLQTVDQLGNLEDRTDFTRAMRGERCFCIVASRRQSENLCGMLDDPELGNTLINRVRLLYFAPILFDSALAHVRKMARYIELSKEPFHVNAAEWDALKDRAAVAKGRLRTQILVAALSPAYARAVEAYDHTGTFAACGRLAIALRLYRLREGAYPEDLQALLPQFIDKLPTDPFSGKGFVYRREGKGFVVYGLGPNRTDEGGLEVRQEPHKGDVVWRCSR